MIGRILGFSPTCANTGGMLHRPIAPLRALVLLAVAVGLASLASACGAERATATRSEPDNEADVAYENGIMAHVEGRLEAAERDLRRAVDLNPRFLAAHVQLGRVLLDMERYDDALDSFDEAISIRDRSGDAYAGRAAALLGLGRPEEAAAAAEQAIDRGVIADSYYVLALAFDRSGEPVRAIELLEEVLREDPDRTQARLELARIQMSLGRSADAVSTIERGARRDDSNMALWTAMGQLYYQRESWDRSIEAWQHVSQMDPTQAQPWIRLGESYLQIENTAQATESLNRALQLDPRAVEAYALRGRSELERGFPQRGIADADAALAISEGYYPALLLRADSLRAQGSVDEAIEYYREAIDAAPDGLDAAVALATIYMEREQYADAAGVLEPYVGTTDDTAILELMLNAYLRSGDADRVLENLVALSESRPDDPARLLSLVQIAVASPDQHVLSSAEVVAHAERALELSGGHRLEYRLALIDALALDGQTARAIQLAEEALDDLPNSPDLLERLRALDR
jgi:tetratricopeptide (TPR) repeat protein